MGERTYLVRLDFASPLHIGEPGIGMERSSTYVPSDTLFGALCSAWGRLYGKRAVDTVIDRFQQGAPFRLSSAFPRLVVEADSTVDEILYVPRPLMRARETKPGGPVDQYAEILTEAKRRMGPYVSLEFLNRWISQQWLSDPDYRELDRSSRLYHLVCDTALTSRVRLDRPTAESDLFFCQLVRFGSRTFRHNGSTARTTGGLYCLVRTGEEEIAARVRSCFQALGEQGIGGERSIGCGRFRINWEDGDHLLSEPSGPASYCVLSLYHPSEAEKNMLKDHLADRPGQSPPFGYELTKRGGWVDSPFISRPRRKRPCWMLREGSVLPFKPQGQLVDVSPEGRDDMHPVYRYGVALSVGVGR